MNYPTLSASAAADVLPFTLLNHPSLTLSDKNLSNNWSGASPVDNSIFAIEHSIDGSNCFPAGEIIVDDNFKLETQFSSTYQTPTAGNNFYRIKQINIDRQFSKMVKQIMAIALIVLGTTANRVFAQNWNHVIKVVASDRAADDLYGRSVAISGDYAIVGAIQEDHNASGADFKTNSGAAYILKNISGNWTEIQKIVASDRSESDYFGMSVAISGDYAIVGTGYEDNDVNGGSFKSNSGAAYIFKNNSGTWSQVQKIVASDRQSSALFANSVSISGDYVVVGAMQEGYNATGGDYKSEAGAAYIFKNNSGTWVQVQKILASDREFSDLFGNSVSISGNYLIVAAYDENHDVAGGNGLARSGSVYIFKNNSGTWTHLQKIVASDRKDNDQFGHSVSISGDFLVVGSRLQDYNETGGSFKSNAGAAYIFKNKSDTWSQVQKIVASNRNTDDFFGFSVSISGNYVIIGAYQEDENESESTTRNQAGSAYIFKNTSGTWSQLQKINAPDRGSDDNFGYSVAISGNYGLVGAWMEKEDASYVGNSLNGAGSAYVFKNCVTSSTDNQTACNSFTWIDNKTYTESNNTATSILKNRAGCDSIITLNLTIKKSSTATDNQTACGSYTWINGITYTASNNSATYKLVNKAGCDSLVTLNLTIKNISDLSTSISGFKIKSNNTNATYQWLDCNNNFAVINGETGQTINATANGNYAVQLKENGCVDTSDCVSLSSAGVLANGFDKALVIHPNPVNDKCSIDLGSSYETIEIVITGMTGKLIEAKTINHSQIVSLNLQVPAGIYIVSIQAGNKKTFIRLVKE